MAYRRAIKSVTGGGRLLGVANVLKNLNREIEAIKGRTLQGLIRAQRIIYHSMFEVSPTIPKDTGNLRNSYFCVTSNGGIVTWGEPAFDNKRKDAARMASEHAAIMAREAARAKDMKARGVSITFGFTAYYATYVHEAVGWKFTLPGSGAKFFQEAINRNRDVVLRVIAESAKIRK